MKKLILLLVLLTLLLGLMPVGMAQAKDPLRGTSTHHFVGDFDVHERFIFWEGEISGDVEGDIRWYGDPAAMWFTGQASHYDMSWEIMDGEGNVILAGEDSGTTTARHGKNSIWRTNGIVTEANEEFQNWIGRHVHMSGHFTWAAAGVPDEGWSILRIN